MKIRVAVEGPYGETSDARKSDTVVYIAGGNGIPGMFSEVTDLAKRYTSTKSVKKLKLYWVIREYRSLNWFFDELENSRKQILKPPFTLLNQKVLLQLKNWYRKLCPLNLI